jgi:hypothetical protein
LNPFREDQNAKTDANGRCIVLFNAVPVGYRWDVERLTIHMNGLANPANSFALVVVGQFQSDILTNPWRHVEDKSFYPAHDVSEYTRENPLMILPSEQLGVLFDTSPAPAPVGSLCTARIKGFRVRV